jgi:nitroreductase
MSNAWDPTAQPPSPHPAPGSGQAANPRDVTRVIKRVRQTRDFLPDPVPEEILTDILDVARWTGSAGNRQAWQFIVVTDPEVKRQMAEAAPYTAHIGIAPVVIAIALEPKSPDGDNFEEARVAERIMIAATAHGLACGVARARGDAQGVIGALLGVPEDRILRTMVSIGYPTAEARRIKTAPGTARKPLGEVVRRERFG